MCSLHNQSTSIKLLVLSILLAQTEQFCPVKCRFSKQQNMPIRCKNPNFSFLAKTPLYVRSDSNNVTLQQNVTTQPESSSSGFKDETHDVQSFLKEKLFLGIEPTPEIISIMAIYFVEGALGLARLAQTFLLKDELHLGPAQLSALTGLFTLPWTIKVSMKNDLFLVTTCDM